MTLPERLSSGLAALGLNVPDAVQKKLIDFIAMLAKWNGVHSLTAVREQEQMIPRHLLDSLSILPALGDQQRLLDVGSGAGLPGIPLAIVQPFLSVTLLDSSHKKAAFLRQAKAELALANVEVICERAEAWKPEEKFSLIVSRAFAELSDFAVLAENLLAPGGHLLAMKGIYPVEEMARLPDNFRVSEVISLKVPQMEAERHLVVMTASE